MINFIICDSNKTFSNETKKIINNIMSKNNNQYKMHMYDDYSADLNRLINDKTVDNKIYILDLEYKNANGIEIAHEIRDNDFNSIIIFFTFIHDKYLHILLKTPLIFNCVNKNEPKQLEKSLIKAVKYVKKDTLNLNNGQIIYKIKYDDILYITTNIENRGITIVTTNEKINHRISLNEISKILNNDFVKTHRACYVNKNRIFKVDFRNREIIFDNLERINLISIREVKKLKEIL